MRLIRSLRAHVHCACFPRTHTNTPALRTRTHAPTPTPTTHAGKGAGGMGMGGMGMMGMGGMGMGMGGMGMGMGQSMLPGMGGPQQQMQGPPPAAQKDWDKQLGKPDGWAEEFMQYDDRVAEVKTQEAGPADMAAQQVRVRVCVLPTMPLLAASHLQLPSLVHHSASYQPLSPLSLSLSLAAYIERSIDAWW